jgi:hypothetical protein
MQSNIQTMDILSSAGPVGLHGPAIDKTKGVDNVEYVETGGMDTKSDESSFDDLSEPELKALEKRRKHSPSPYLVIWF